MPNDESDRAGNTPGRAQSPSAFGLRPSAFLDMLPDLERLVRLQQIETAAENGRRWLETLPADHQALDSRLAATQGALDDAKSRLAASATARRDIEKELGVVQSRLSKFKDQLMEVKTNKEYQAMQKEIATAEREVRSFEDRILDKMEEAEGLQAEVKRAEADLKKEQAAIADARRTLETERGRVESNVAKLSADRAALVGEIASPALALFDHISRSRKAPAVVEAREGHCSFCHVRLRPQVFNEIRRNDQLIQCDSCQRILYFAGSPAVAEPQAQSPKP
ncbi:MAG: zinc ribbon domain-containing protein [Vicinamibacterales bacterium]